MIFSDDKHLLFIEPKSKKMEPDVIDEITIYFEEKAKKMKGRNDFTKGVHTCSCKKAHSTSQTFKLSLAGKTYITNSLAVHYIKNHRSEVPDSELNKIIEGMEFDQNKVQENIPKKIKPK